MTARIRSARDVLARLNRDEWEVIRDDDFDRWEIVEVARRFEGGFVAGRTVATFDREYDARRAAVMAGNPDLLHACDSLLDDPVLDAPLPASIRRTPMNTWERRYRGHADRVARAINVVDDQMGEKTALRAWTRTTPHGA